MRLLITGASGFIGTNYVDYACERAEALLNVDISKPIKPEHLEFWREGDIMNAAELQEIFREFAPTHLIHMAARVDCDEDTTVENGYCVNTTGTQNVIDAARKTLTIERAIFVSTQFVAGPGRLPCSDQDFFPHTVYGQSKVITENLVRSADLACCWTLVRPTNVWGPWHMRYRQEAWRVLRRGLYLHPGGSPVVRSYGFVGNIVWQIDRLLSAPVEKVNGQVFYVGDRPDDIYEWVNAFSVSLRGRPARRVPRPLLKPIALAGDALAALGKPFPLTSSRLTSMTSDYPTPMDKTFDTLGNPPYSLQEGVEVTADWLRRVGWS